MISSRRSATGRCSGNVIATASWGVADGCAAGVEGGGVCVMTASILGARRPDGPGRGESGTDLGLGLRVRM